MSDFSGDALRRQLAEQSAFRDEMIEGVQAREREVEAQAQRRVASANSGRMEQQLASQRAEAHRKEQLSELAAIKEATLESQAATTQLQAATLQVQEATRQVAQAVVDMNTSTTRLQKWAIGLGLIGAVTAAFIGAVAARIVGA